jgi:hypothetical protein
MRVQCSARATGKISTPNDLKIITIFERNMLASSNSLLLSEYLCAAATIGYCDALTTTLSPMDSARSRKTNSARNTRVHLCCDGQIQCDYLTLNTNQADWCVDKTIRQPQTLGLDWSGAITAMKGGKRQGTRTSLRCAPIRSPTRIVFRQEILIEILDIELLSSDPH